MAKRKGFLQGLLDALTKGATAPPTRQQTGGEYGPPDPVYSDDRGPLTEGHAMLVQGPPLAVVGEASYRSTIERLTGGPQPRGVKAVTVASLIREPDNPHDPNAIAVWINGECVGYLARQDARRYGPVTQRAAKEGFVPCVRADIYGGWLKRSGVWADYGVTLYVGEPEELMARPKLASREGPT